VGQEDGAHWLHRVALSEIDTGWPDACAWRQCVTQRADAVKVQVGETALIRVR
jgi:hypothetical protein